MERGHREKNQGKPRESGWNSSELQLQMSPALAVASIWGMSQWHKISLSVSVQLWLLSKRNVSFEKKIRVIRITFMIPSAYFLGIFLCIWKFLWHFWTTYCVERTCDWKRVLIRCSQGTGTLCPELFCHLFHNNKSDGLILPNAVWVKILFVSLWNSNSYQKHPQKWIQLVTCMGSKIILENYVIYLGIYSETNLKI